MVDIRPEDVALAARLGDVLGEATLPVSLPDEVRRTVAGLRAVFDAAACSFAQLQPDGETLRFVGADGAGAREIIGVELPVGRGIVGWAAMSGESVHVHDVAADSRFERVVAESTRYVPSSILAAPVIDTTGEPVGVIELLDPSIPGTDVGRALAVVELVATQLAAVVRLAGRYDALGSGLLRMLADPGASYFGGGNEESTGSDSLSELATAFRTLAARPGAAASAASILRAIAAYVEEQR
jgi:GAF domain-containing protein